MLAILILAEISIGNFIFGYVPETATLMVLGIGLIVSSVGLRRVLKHKEEKKTQEEKTETDKR